MSLSSCSEQPASSSQVELILGAALSEYKKQTGRTLSDDGLSEKLQTCDSIDDVLAIIQQQAEAFDKFRGGDRRLMKWIGSSVDVLYKISDALGESLNLVRTRRPIHDALRCRLTIVVQALPSAKAVFAGIGVLLAVRRSAFPCFDRHI